MRKLLTLALALVTLALALITPPLRGSRVMAQPPPQTQTIILNTGYDQWLLPTPDKIAIGQKDNEWRVITDSVNGVPDPLIATGKPADVVPATSWATATANFLHSRWVSVTPNQGAPLPTPPPSGPFNEFQYAYYFTLPVGFSNPVLTMKLSADDHITKVTLNSHTLFQGSGGIFINPPLMIPTLANPTTLADFMSGSDVNMLTVDVEDTAGGITGLIVDGTVTYQDCDRLPIRDIPGLTSITFWESTFAQPTQHTFAATGPQLTTRLNALDSSNNDFVGAPGLEFYDVFYSDWNGAPSPTGQFVTIEAAVPTIGYPSGGGLNIARVDFDGTGQFANSVSSFVCLGNNALPSIVGNAVDGSVGTDTTMGNTIGQTQRLRLTVGVPCCTSPPPGMVAWWPLDELAGATTVVDIAGSHNGVPKPGGAIGPPGGPTSVSGQVGTALQAAFSQGTGGYVEVPTTTALDFGTADFSIDAWVMFPSGLHAVAIVNKYDLVTNTGYSLYTTFQNGPLTLALQIGTEDYYGPPIPTNLPVGTWIFVAATRSVVGTTTTVRLYVNSASVTVTNPTSSASSPGTPLLIGEWPGHVPPLHVDIAIDELEIFNRALTQQPEIQSIFNAGSAGKCRARVFNVCLQDDSNSNTVFLADTFTGAYRFCCGGTTFTGVAQVTKRGNIATFQQYGPDRRVTAKIDGGVFKGSASLQSPPGATICTIADRDTRNNSCICQ